MRVRASVRMYVCVCVCVREREREREGGRGREGDRHGETNWHRNRDILSCR